jgi:hypothetical protein
MDEMDPTPTVLEYTKEFAQQKYLHALEDSVTNVEFSAYLIALRQQQSTMSAVGDSCLRQEDLEEAKEASTASPPATARRRQRAAFARFVKKIKQRAGESSARAEASKVLKKDSGADINPADEDWRTWEDTSDVDEDERCVGSETSRSAGLVDLPSRLSQRQESAHEYEGLGYSNTVSSFAASRHWEQRLAQRIEETGVPTTSHQQ